MAGGGGGARLVAVGDQLLLLFVGEHVGAGGGSSESVAGLPGGCSWTLWWPGRSSYTGVPGWE